MKPYEILQLNRQKLESLADAVAGVGYRMMEPAPQVGRLVDWTQISRSESTSRERIAGAASCFIYSGVCRAILGKDLERARTEIRSAGVAFGTIGHPYQLIAAICISDETSIAMSLGKSDDGQPMQFWQLAMALLFIRNPDFARELFQRRWAAANKGRRTAEPVAEAGESRIGVLGFRARELDELLADMSKVLRHRATDSGNRAFGWVLRSLDEADSDLTVRQRDSFHWEHLAPPVFPMEPEAIALGALAMSMAKMEIAALEPLGAMALRAKLPMSIAELLEGG